MSDVDLLGFDITPVRAANKHLEADALAEVLKALRGHDAVAWAHRQNTGAAKVGGRFVRFGWKGCSDIIGMMRDGRLLACEVKAPKGKLRTEQAEFLSLVQKHGGVGFVARNCVDVLRGLA